METVKLGLLIKKTKVARCGNHSYPVLSITKQDGIIMQNEKFKKRVASADTSDYKIIPRGKLVQGIHIDEGNFGIQDIVDNGIVSPAYGVWDVNDGLVVPKYLEMVLRSPKSIEFYRSKLTGTVNRRGHMSDTDFLSMDVPLPDKGTQFKILETMKQTTSVLCSRQQQLVKLDELIKARFVEMFGGINDSNLYPYSTIDSFTTVTSGGTPDRSVSEYWINGNIRWVKTTELQNRLISNTEEHITQSGLDNSSAKIIPADTVLIAMYGQGKTRGMTAYLSSECATNQACACILPSKVVNQKFLWHYMILSYNKLRDMAKGGNQLNLNIGLIKQFPVPIPPLSLQNQFASFVEEVDKSKVEVQKALDQTQLLFDSLMQQYFG